MSFFYFGHWLKGEAVGGCWKPSGGEQQGNGHKTARLGKHCPASNTSPTLVLRTRALTPTAFLPGTAREDFGWTGALSIVVSVQWTLLGAMGSDWVQRERPGLTHLGTKMTEKWTVSCLMSLLNTTLHLYKGRINKPELHTALHSSVCLSTASHLSQ